MSFDVEDFDGQALSCTSCRTDSLYTKSIPAASDLARHGLEAVHASRCFGCGDIRLIGTYWNVADRHDIRGELDHLAAIMSEIAAEERHGTRQ